MSAAAAGRGSFTPYDTVKYIWEGLGLPSKALHSLHLDGSGHGYPSSFKIGHLAQSAIALSALSAAVVDSVRKGRSDPVRRVTVPFHQACLDFKTEELYTVDGKPPDSSWGPIGGLHETQDGHVRIHDVFMHHRNGALKLLGLPESASRNDVSARVRTWKKLELEQRAHENGVIFYALRSYREWDATPQSQAVPDFPITIRKINDAGPTGLPQRMQDATDRCLRGLRMVELSRVIAAPVAGRVIASHGADVLWVTSPNLPDLPPLDRNLSRGKRTIQLDLDKPDDCDTLATLTKDCDVFMQGYRPESLANRGFSSTALAELRPGIVVANLSAFGTDGPWADRRGFDSMVQTCTGMNVSEAEQRGAGEAARPMPCQALDYAAGYFLATGISTALYRRALEGGSWEVNVSLAGVAKYLRSLGQSPGKESFECDNPAADLDKIPDEFFEVEKSGFGQIRALKEVAAIDGAMPGFEHMPKPLGGDEPRWL